MRTGIATIPLDYGKCPYWLFERMERLARGIVLAIREEFSSGEILKRFSDPIWFQSFGCVLAFDWNSSGLTTTTLGAVKAAIFDIQDELDIYVCGGKGRTSRKTPKEIETYGISRGFSFTPQLVYASKMSAKIDSALIQDNYQIYHHNFLFTKSGNWVVIQQGLNSDNQTARRYHWLSSGVKDFVEEPHSGIISGTKVKPLNLTAKESRENREISAGLVKEEPKRFLKDFRIILNKGSQALIKKQKIGHFTSMELFNKEFYWHPVAEEKFDLKRLEKTIFFANSQEPESFEKLLSLKGIGPKTIRALSLVSEIIYGAKPSYEDPARYSFAHGGKDGTPTNIDLSTFSQTTQILERAIKRAKIENREKTFATRRLRSLINV